MSTGLSREGTVGYGNPDAYGGGNPDARRPHPWDSPAADTRDVQRPAGYETSPVDPYRYAQDRYGQLEYYRDLQAERAAELRAAASRHEAQGKSGMTRPPPSSDEGSSSSEGALTERRRPIILPVAMDYSKSFEELVAAGVMVPDESVTSESFPTAHGRGTTVLHVCPVYFDRDWRPPMAVSRLARLGMRPLTIHETLTFAISYPGFVRLSSIVVSLGSPIPGSPPRYPFIWADDFEMGVAVSSDSANAWWSSSSSFLGLRE